MNTESGTSPAEWTWTQRAGYIDMGGFLGIFGRYCGNCWSRVYLKDCPNDECYNFARGIDFWLTGEEWMQNESN